MTRDQIPKYLADNVEFYRRSSREFRCFSDLPLVSKADIRREYENFLSDLQIEYKKKVLKYYDGFSKGSVVNGRSSDIKISEDIVVECTSGTSGLPLAFPKTRSERSALSIGIWSERKRLDPLASSSSFFMFMHPPVGYEYEFDPYNCEIDNLVRLYQWMKKKRIRWIHARPSKLLRHLKIFSNANITLILPDLKFVEVASEYLSEEDKERIEQSLDVEVVNQYGSREVWAIGYGQGENVFRESKNVYVELFDDHGNTIESTGEAGRLVVTSRCLKLMPIVRYMTGDIGEWVESPYGRAPKERCFRLHADKEANLIEIDGRRVSGNRLFKSVLDLTYNMVGNLAIDYLQVRQTARTELVLVVNEFEGAEHFRSTFEKICRSKVKDIKVKLKQVNESEWKRYSDKSNNLFVHAISNEG